MVPAILGAAWVGLLIGASFIAGRACADVRTPADGNVASALDLLTDEGVLSVEARETLWREYAMKVRTA